MIIDLEQNKLMRDREYESRLKQIEKRIKEEQELRKELKLKHDHKLELAKTKNEQLAKD